ncbi:MAG: ParB/RepB/Spo0J family partition protein [Gemmataceae bacterium]
MAAPAAYYPTTGAGRHQLAAELTARGLVPTQAKADFSRATIDAIAAAMADGSFDWTAAGLQPVVMGPGGEVLGGHHRVVAAHLTGTDLTTVPGPRPQVQRLPVNYRPVRRWIDVLPDVQ